MNLTFVIYREGIVLGPGSKAPPFDLCQPSPSQRSKAMQGATPFREPDVLIRREENGAVHASSKAPPRRKVRQAVFEELVRFSPVNDPLMELKFLVYRVKYRSQFLSLLGEVPAARPGIFSLIGETPLDVDKEEKITIDMTK